MKPAFLVSIMAAIIMAFATCAGAQTADLETLEPTCVGTWNFNSGVMQMTTNAAGTAGPDFRQVGYTASANIHQISYINGVVGNVHNFSRLDVMCSGGANAGTLCTAHSMCPGADCSAGTGAANGEHIGGWTWTVQDTKRCMSGSNATAICRTNSQCPSSTCGNVCTGGSNAGGACDNGSACPGGGCTGGGNMLFTADAVVTPDDTVFPNSANAAYLFLLGRGTGDGSSPTTILELHNHRGPGIVCTGGSNDGTACVIDSACTGGGKCRIDPDNEGRVTLPRQTNLYSMGTNSSGDIIGRGNGTPSVSSCGSGSSRTGRDNAGKITVGTGATTSCTLTFAVSKTNTPACVASIDSTTIALSVVPAQATVVVTSSADMASKVLSYICEDL